MSNQNLNVFWPPIKSMGITVIDSGGYQSPITNINDDYHL